MASQREDDRARELVLQLLGALSSYTFRGVGMDLLQRTALATVEGTEHPGCRPSMFDPVLAKFEEMGLAQFTSGWALTEQGLDIALKYRTTFEVDVDPGLQAQAVRLPCFAQCLDTQDDICLSCPGRALCATATHMRQSAYGDMLDLRDANLWANRRSEREAAQQAMFPEPAGRVPGVPEEVDLSDLLEEVVEPPTQPLSAPFSVVSPVPSGTYCGLCKAKIKAGSSARTRPEWGIYHPQCEGIVPL